MKGTDFVIFRSRQCGTTALVSHLAQRPDVCGPKRKECYNLSTDLTFTHSICQLSRERYLSHCAGRQRELVACQATVRYLYYREASKNIRASAPDERGWTRKLWRGALPPAARGAVLRRVKALNTRHAERPAIATDVRAELSAHLRPDVERLEALLDRDLGAWKNG